MSASIQIRTREWSLLRPEPSTQLEGLALDPQSRELAAALTNSGMLEVVELRAGLQVRTVSYVGRVRLGDVEVTIQPKLESGSLLRLLRYAYGFRKLDLFPETQQHLERLGFVDILVSQLNAEVRELIARGLQRAYVPTHEWLPSPRGRIDISRLAASGPLTTAALPCTHFPRIEDIPLNRVLRAGLQLAGALASDVALRRESRQLSGQLQESVAAIRLGSGILDRVESGLNRMTRAYGPAIRLIRMLFESQGISLENSASTLRLHGFLFDMNRFFQALLSRFLGENLPNHAVHEEFTLPRVLRYLDGWDAPHRLPPRMRPDFIVQQGRTTVAVLDSKYRDLWEKPLPREMLYQLAVYAVVHESRIATILYPTMTTAAREVRIEVRDVVQGERRAVVCLRPVLLNHLERHALSGDTAVAVQARQEFARHLAFGDL